METFTVSTISDRIDPNDGVLSLREALALADADRATADTILFAPAVQGRTIVLAGSQLTVNSDVTIDGGSGVTIDADGKSRVLLVQGDGDGRGARAPDHHRRPDDGRSPSPAAASMPTTSRRWRSTTQRSAATARRARLPRAAGSSGLCYVTLTDSTVSGNRTAGEDAQGGGIVGANVHLIDSTVSGNRTAGAYAKGGGIYAVFYVT